MKYEIDFDKISPRRGIRLCRAILELTQTEMAEAIGVSLATYSSWELDNRAMPVHKYRSILDLLFQ